MRQRQLLSNSRTTSALGQSATPTIATGTEELPSIPDANEGAGVRMLWHRSAGRRIATGDGLFTQPPDATAGGRDLGLGPRAATTLLSNACADW